MARFVGVALRGHPSVQLRLVREYTKLHCCVDIAIDLEHARHLGFLPVVMNLSSVSRARHCHP